MKTRWSRNAVRAFEMVFRPYLRRRLAGVYLYQEPADWPAIGSVILAANHVSWWDGFLLREVHRHLGKGASLYTLMLESELRQLPFFRWLGAVGVASERPASILHSARFFKDRKEQEGRCWLSFFPQGRIWPSWKRPLAFKEGIRLYAGVLQPVLVVPVGLHLEPLNRSAPTAFVSIGAPLVVSAAALDVGELERRVTREVDRILGLLAVHGEAVAGAWPGQRL